MHIAVLSIRERDGQIVAYARAVAENAVIHLQVQFTRPLATKAELWEVARDEVLRYLDVA